MTGTHMKLTIVAKSTEGTDDFIKILENVIDDIKGGIERNTHFENDEGRITNLTWSIDPE